MNENEKENMTTIILVLVIIFVFVLMGYFIFNVITKDTQNSSDEYAEENLTLDNDTTNVDDSEYIEIVDEEITEEVTEEISEEVTEEKSSQEIFFENVANAYNESDAVKSLNLSGYVSYATAAEDALYCNFTVDGVTYIITFLLDDSIFYTDIPPNSNNTLTASKLQNAIIVMDAVAQVKGYEERELTLALSENEAQYYTVENEGVEFVFYSEDGNTGVILKVDVNSDFSFLNN